jgi:hypothetical protein
MRGWAYVKTLCEADDEVSEVGTDVGEGEGAEDEAGVADADGAGVTGDGLEGGGELDAGD